MIRLSTLLLAPPVGERLRARYDDYRQHGASWLSASLGCLWASLVWALMPLETPRWQAILARHETYFPHINPHRPRPLDPLRYLLQSLWLLTTRVPEPEKKVNWRSLAALEGVHGRYTQWLEKLPEQMNARTGHLDKQKELAHLNPKLRRAILGGVTFCSLVLALMCITQPFNPLSQFIFLMLLWGVALLVRRIPGRFSALMLIVLSLTVSCRYIWWRYTSTLNWNDPVSLVCGIILLFAETYAWVVLVLGYFQVVWPLNRQPVPLPEDMDLWPTVDIFVPTYNEDLNVVKNTIYASQGIDWPKDKLNIWILDDGGREAFRQFAKDVGVHYIARTSHEHAKAGNINNALKYAKGEFVSIFDCDHVPTRSFLQMTMGWFLKEKELAMMQTPHHFFSPDPFERNLGRFRKTPNEGTLFYGLVQDGNDMWDATFFCGSCAVIRRGPLDEIGGIAVETVTEDAHTSLRLHRRGYTSAYMRIPQAAVKSGNTTQAVADLQKAVQADSRDSDAVGALGQAYSQRGDRARAVAQLSKAIAMDPDSPNRGKWDSLLQTNRYWLLIKQGDNALKAGQLSQAQNYYAQAQRVDRTDSYAVLGLGDVAAARKEAAAERYYQQALRLDRGNNLAVRGLANLYRAESPEKASAWIAGLPPAQRRSIDDIERSLTNDRLEKQAQALESQGNWAQAAEVQRRRLALDPDSVWITYRLARDLVSAGERQEADALMRTMVNRQPQDAERVYASGLYLSGNDQDDLALAQIAALPRSAWTDNIRELEARLQSDRVLRQANQLRDSGDEAQAIALIKRQPASVRYDLTLADWAQQRGDSQTAIADYQRVLRQEADNGDARLGLAEVYLAEGDKPAARAQVMQLKGAETESMNMQRRVALARAGLGDTADAQRIFNQIVPQAKAQPPSMESALVLRDAARFATQSGAPQQALTHYREAMVASGITPAQPQDNDTFTRLTRNDSHDDWLKRGIRSDAADLYRQQDLNVTLEHDFWGSRGTGGYSDLKAHTTMLQVDAPLADGRMFFRTDLVNMDAGSFSTHSDGSYSPSWGTCGEIACTSGSKNQTDSGASVAVGWKNDTWSGDIGTTPMGFNVVDVVGGLSYSSDVGPVGYTVNVHRRPISSSLLSFGGQKDSSSHTGATWGGVRADGGGLSLSYDRGEAHGIWSSLGADSLTGKNVADNWRVRWMTGYYYKVINENNRRVTVGLNNMIWHYDKDLSGYTLGQGGYYSPQEYLSFAVPVTWRQRTENWSWELGGSVSWSHSRTQTQARYPLLNLIPSDYRQRASELTEEGSSSHGFGYTARALVERRVTSNWFVGAAVDIQQAKDYTPSHALLYVRYSAAGWQGDLDMPPQPLVPYADW